MVIIIGSQPLFRLRLVTMTRERASFRLSAQITSSSKNDDNHSYIVVKTTIYSISLLGSDSELQNARWWHIWLWRWYYQWKWCYQWWWRLQWGLCGCLLKIQAAQKMMTTIAIGDRNYCSLAQPLGFRTPDGGGYGSTSMKVFFLAQITSSLKDDDNISYQWKK